MEHFKNAEDGGEDKERGVYAIFFVIVCFLMWHFLVYLWSPRKGSFCCCK